MGSKLLNLSISENQINAIDQGLNIYDSFNDSYDGLKKEFSEDQI